MLKFPKYASKDWPIMIGSMIPYTVVLNSIIFGERYYQEWRLAIFASVITFLIMSFSYIVYGNVALIFRHRFPDDAMFVKRTMIQVFLFLLMSALILVGLFSIYVGAGFLETSYEDKFTWAYIFTGIVNIFLSFLNEGIYRFEQWKTDLKDTEQLKMTYKQGQLMGLRSQINPHVLFNSLNSLSGLIQEDTAKAERFLDEMSKVYRYMLRNEEEQLVPLSTELQFIGSYFALLKARYNDAIDLRLTISEEDKSKYLPPLSLQVIIENALFQNKAGKDSPLEISIVSVRGDAIVVSNNVQRKVITETVDYEAGLDNLVRKYQLMNHLPVEIREVAGERRIRLPLIQKEEEVLS